jgi:Kdo2-lipid IVA lauroyltransferase/acyltransferase
MDFILTIFFFFFVFLTGSLPFLVLYLFSDFIFFMLFRVTGYRKKVVAANLEKAFPEVPASERQKIMKKFYHHLADIMVEGIKAFTMSRKQILKRHKISNPEILEPFYQSGRSIIGCPAHYGNWEWGSLSASLQVKHHAIAFYKPLSNKRMDRVMRKNRSRFGTELASIYETSDTFQKNMDKPTLFLMVSDQSPSNHSKAYWVNFLGLDTGFLHGMEKHAKTHNFPVIYVDIIRIRRGYYSLELTVLSDDPASLPEGELTKRYAAKLESVIRKEPAHWLWSHRRWKLKR